MHDFVIDYLRHLACWVMLHLPMMGWKRYKLSQAPGPVPPFDARMLASAATLADCAGGFAADLRPRCVAQGPLLTLIPAGHGAIMAWHRSWQG